MTSLVIGREVAAALADGQGVVALESTIFSSLGLPAPDNERVLMSCCEAIRAEGAVPALCAVIDGVANVGTTNFEAVLGATRKLGERDLGVAMATGTTGVTTVSATVALAHAAGIKVFATGGIGGVHRGSQISGDISADLMAIARFPVLTVTAGVKGFLDVGLTVEYLETLGVPVLGWRTDDFPAFWCRTSGSHVSAKVDSASEVAEIIAAGHILNLETGLVLAVPCPRADAIDEEEMEPIITTALAAAHDEKIRGGAVTPFVLEQIRLATAGRSISSNCALAVNNARIAASVSLALAKL